MRISVTRFIITSDCCIRHMGERMFWIFALLMFQSALIPAADAECRLSTNKKKYNLSCSDDGKIFDINITAALGNCTQTLCNGNTPQLIMEKLCCYWKNNCSIDFPKDIIIQSTDDSKCTGTKPDILLLYWWKCTKKGVKIYDFTEKTDFNMSYEGGILRSHARFPWDYFFTDFCMDCRSSTYSKAVTFWLKPNIWFVFTVHKVNITEPDSFTWHTKQDITPRAVSVGTMIFNYSAEQISLQLNVNDDSNGDSGFLICYKFLSSRNTQMDACSDLTTTLPKSAGEKDTGKKKGGKNKNKGKTENNGKQTSGKKPKGNNNNKTKTGR